MATFSFHSLGYLASKLFISSLMLTIWPLTFLSDFFFNLRSRDFFSGHNLHSDRVLWASCRSCSALHLSPRKFRNGYSDKRTSLNEYVIFWQYFVALTGIHFRYGVFFHFCCFVFAKCAHWILKWYCHGYGFSCIFSQFFSLFWLETIVFGDEECCMRHRSTDSTSKTFNYSMFSKQKIARRISNHQILIWCTVWAVWKCTNFGKMQHNSTSNFWVYNKYAHCVIRYGMGKKWVYN